jgi:NodT family efflux transporter outer membrane factor (OMF) lipoprotein
MNLKRLRFAMLLGLHGAALGCAVGPDFHPPEAPKVVRYPTTPLPEETIAVDVPGGHAQRFAAGRDVPAEWWTLFQSPALDSLVRQALADSPRLAQARAKLVRAQEGLRAREGATKLPKVDASGSANRIAVGSDGTDSEVLSDAFPLTLSVASVSVSYTLDLFGRNRRELEGLRAAAEYEGFELEAARLMLAGNVVAAAIQEASLREQIATTEAVVALDAGQVEIVERLLGLGAVPKLDVVVQRSELLRRRATLPVLREQLERTRHRLAVYLGQPPGAATLPELRLSDLKLPSELPLSLPSELVRQRPDIRAAEALLHQASAQVGVATANMYPRITLSGTGGAVAVSSLLSGAAGFGLLGVSVAQPLFHGGELKAQKRSAVAAFDQAGAAYREVVLVGLQDVADTLVALDADATTLREHTEAATLAKTAHEITAKRYEAGGVSLLELQEAERRRLSALLDETRAIADRYADSAALFQALGGGWWTQAAAPSGTGQ